LAAVLLTQDGRFSVSRGRRGPAGRSAPRAPARRSAPARCARRHRARRCRRPVVLSLVSARRARPATPMPPWTAPTGSLRCVRHHRPPLRGRLGEPKGCGFRRGAERRGRRTERNPGAVAWSTQHRRVGGPDRRRGELCGCPRGADDQRSNERRATTVATVPDANRPHGQTPMAPRRGPAEVTPSVPVGAHGRRRPAIESRLAVLIPCSIRRGAVYH
jgi:hypothetical protein